MNLDLGLPEPTQAMANLRLTQQRKEEACTFLDETYNRLCQCGKICFNPYNTPIINRIIVSSDENTLPSLEFRIFTGKLLIEVEKYEQACYARR